MHISFNNIGFLQLHLCFIWMLYSFVHLKNLKAINDLTVGKSFSEIHYKFAFGLNLNFAMELENFPIKSVFII